MELETTIGILGLLFIFFWVSLSMRRSLPKPLVHAGEKFSESFWEQIQDLSQGREDAFEFLKSAFSKEEKAYLQFRAYLKGKTLQQFDEAWREYYCRDKTCPHPFPEQYFAAGDPALAEEKRHLALRRIRRLLSFVKNY